MCIHKYYYTKLHNLMVQNNTDLLSDRYNKQLEFLKSNHINISTITLDCKLGADINTKLFCKYVDMNPDEIVSVTYSSRSEPFINRKIVCTLKKKTPSKKIFYNQSTIIMASHIDVKKYGYMNMKVFKNGALHVTGCKDLQDFYLASNTLLRILNNGKHVSDENTISQIYKDIKPNKSCKKQTSEIIKTRIKKTNNNADTTPKPKHNPIVKTDDGIKINYVSAPVEITDLSVRMINSNFSKKYKIYRKNLYDILRTKHHANTADYIPCKFDPTGGHSCVNIKYRYKNMKDISIFVFQTGSILVTGAKYFDQIIEACNFINALLDKYYDDIVIYNYDLVAVNKVLDEYFKSKNINNGVTNTSAPKIGLDKYVYVVK